MQICKNTISNLKALHVKKMFPDEMELQTTLNGRLSLVEISGREAISRADFGVRVAVSLVQESLQDKSSFRAPTLRFDISLSLSLSLSLSPAHEVSFSYSVRAPSTFFRRCTTSIIILEFATLGRDT